MVSNVVLWKKLSSLSFDHSGAEFPFSARLARENVWSPHYAARVVEEYRRFAYLAMVAGHEVTPSDEVDQAWHLHLTYTRHYWGEFADALGAPLHHGPTKGGSAERHRYADNYAQTKQSYRREFGEEPPADIWPPSAVRFGRAPHMQRLNTSDLVMIPKARLAVAAGAFSAVCLGFVIVAINGLSPVAAQIEPSGNSSAQAGGGGTGLADRLLAFVDDNRPLAIVVAVLVLVLFRTMVRSSSGRRKSGSGCGGVAGGCGGSGKSSGGDSGCGGGCGGCGS